MIERITPHLQKLIKETGGSKGPIGLQFMAHSSPEGSNYSKEESDPLDEEKYKVAPGLIYKYPGRALFTITGNCAAFCRYCTRGRNIGEGSLSGKEIYETLNYIENDKSINEIILSGGDPFTIKPKTFNHVCGRLGEMQRNGKLKIVRVGTRLPISSPQDIKEYHFEALKNLKNPRFMIHVNHPAELTPDSLSVLQKLRKDCEGIIMSQTVLLKGVNNNIDTLHELFTKWTEEGFIPYYLFQNDPVPWAKHFTVPLTEGVSIWRDLKPSLTGIAATLRFVIDTKNNGKVDVV